MNTKSSTSMKVLAAVLWILNGFSGGLYAADAVASKPLDVRVTHKIHSAIVEDATLPYCAHIVRVSAQGDKVVLCGKVHSEQEQAKVIQKAASIIGPQNVVNNVVIAGLAQ